MSNKRTQKKIKKIKVKKNNKSKRKYKKKGAGQTVSRLRRGRERNQNETTPPSSHTPPGSPPREPSPPATQLILDSDNLHVAEASYTPVVPAAVATSNEVTTEPILNVYSNDRLWTVRMIMDDFEFNSIKEPLKQKLKSALLDYERHGDNLITVHYTARSGKVDDAFEPRPHSKKKMYVPGELRILVSEWNQWRKFNKINLEEAIIDLIATLKTPEDTDIMYEYGNH